MEIINAAYGKPDVIAGVATGGIAIGALVAQGMGPAICVRAVRLKNMALPTWQVGEMKKRTNRGGGGWRPDKHGGSSLKSSGSREKGCNVKGMVAILLTDWWSHYKL